MKCYCDRFLYAAIIIAHILLYLSFSHITSFWLYFTASFLILIIIALYKEHMKFYFSFKEILLYGVSSGFGLYLLFAFGNYIMQVLQVQLIGEIHELYKTVNPTLFWQYLTLFLIIIPGEEIFWRGYIQKRLSYYISPKRSIIFASLLYASANIYADSILLLFAALLSGLLWGGLYHWKKNLLISIASHIVFDLLILVIFPLYL